MPAPNSRRPADHAPDRGQAAPPTIRQDLSAIPSFLRRPAHVEPPPGQPRTPTTGTRPSHAALPRPATPPPPPAAGPPAQRQSRLDPASLPMPSLSRRRLITAAGVIVAGLLILTFARQLNEATAATNRAADLRAANLALADVVARLQTDLDRVQDVRFIKLQGRSFGLGGPGEVPFALAAGAPPLDADAPGSEAVRLGAVQHTQSPLDAWLEILFGPSR